MATNFEIFTDSFNDQSVTLLRNGPNSVNIVISCFRKRQFTATEVPPIELDRKYLRCKRQRKIFIPVTKLYVKIILKLLICKFKHCFILT